MELENQNNNDIIRMKGIIFTGAIISFIVFAIVLFASL